jgi:hypothetical protein
VPSASQSFVAFRSEQQLAEVLTLVMITLQLRGSIFDVLHLALASFRDGFSRWALLLFRAGMASFLFELIGLPL